jgi:hypothetical protein
MKAKLSYIALLLLLSLPSYAQPYATLPSATALRADIRSLGAKQVLWERLWSSPNVFDDLIGKVEQGNPAWLEIAQSLYSASDAGASEMLTYALVKALPKRPADVLRSTSRARQGRAIDLETVCSAGIYYEDTDTTQKEWKAASTRAVSRIRANDLRQAREACLKNLSAVKG